jgi:hypothetical protein
MAEHDEDPLQRIEDELRASRARLTGRPVPTSPDPTLFGDGTFEDTWPEAVEALDDSEPPYLGVDDHPTVDLQADLDAEEGLDALRIEAVEPDPTPVVDIPILSDPEDFVVEIPPLVQPTRAIDPAPTQPIVVSFDAEPTAAEADATAEPEPFILELPTFPDLTVEPSASMESTPSAEPVRAFAPVAPADVDAATGRELLAQLSALGRRMTDAVAEVAERQQRLEAMLLTQSVAPTAVAAPSPGGAPSEMEEWSMALARLVRADSEALRTEVQRIAMEQRDALAALDELREADVRIVNQRIDEVMLRVDNAVFRLADSIERRLSAAIDGLEYAAQTTRQADRQALLATVEDRVEALARLIRSDHEHLAAKVAADQEAGKLALRSAKEVQASLPREIADAIDRRLAGFVRTLNS